MGVTKFTLERRNNYVKAISVGASRSLAAKAAGWSMGCARTYWLEGERVRQLVESNQAVTDTELEYLEYLEEVEAAESRSAQAALAVVLRAASSGVWQAGAWFLERRWPEQYARRTSVEVHSGPDALNGDTTAKDLLKLIAAVRVEDNPKEIINVPALEPGPRE